MVPRLSPDNRWTVTVKGTVEADFGEFGDNRKPVLA